MYEVIHRRAFDGHGAGWVFNCPAAPGIDGGARTYDASVDAAKHAARHYLSRVAGRPVALGEAGRHLRHRRDVAHPVGSRARG